MMDSLRLPIIALVAVVFTSLLFLMSCGRSESSRELEEIRLYMDSHADSRIDDLLAIDPATLDGESDRMLYEVLLTQALDKAHESLASRDSVMQVAADWFSARSDTRNAFLATYFLGRVKYEKEEYPQALAAMFKAHDLAKELDDKFWIGMSARGISDIYNASYNFADALKYTEIELENLQLAGRQPYINYAMLDLGNAYCSSSIFDSVEVTLNQVVDSALKYNDSYLNYAAKEAKVRTLIEQHRDLEAVGLLQELSKTPYFNIEDSTFLGLCYLRTGDIYSAEKIAENLDDNSDPHVHWLKNKVYKALGKYELALSHKEKDDSLYTLNIIKRFGSDISSIAVDYYNLKKQNISEKLRSSRIIFLMCIIIISFVFLILFYLAYRYHCKTQERIECNIVIAQNFRELFLKKESEYNTLHSLLIEKFRSEFSILDNLCQEVYAGENQMAVRRRLSTAVANLIEEFSNDKKLIQLEQSVNRVCCNIMAEFRYDFPNLREMDYKLFLYTILGFSASTITMFLKESKISSIYERKRRLKDRIKKSEKENTSKYLEYF